jgi:hypothetical protein
MALTLASVLCRSGPVLLQPDRDSSATAAEPPPRRRMLPAPNGEEELFFVPGTAPHRPSRRKGDRGREPLKRTRDTPEGREHGLNDQTSESNRTGKVALPDLLEECPSPPQEQ